jgi:regulator of replication initiation timing
MASAAQAKYVIKLEDKTKRAFKAIGKSLKRTTSAVFSMKTGFISAAGIAGIGYFVKKSLDATDEMAKMSRAIGVSVEELQRLRHAASLGGLEAVQLDKAVQKLAVNMADMSRGVGLAKDVFEKYNIEVENSDGSMRGVVDVMADVADVTAGLTNKTEKADIAYKLFGARGAKMINVLEGGSKAMREAMGEADKLGLVMSADTAKGVEKANDAFTRLGAFLTSSFAQAVAKIAPAIETITNSIRDWVEMKVTEAGGIGAIARNMAEAIVLSSVSILEAFEAMGNGMIDFVNKIKANLPEALGGFRDTKEILEDIQDVSNKIGMTKASMAGGKGLLDLLGIGDESALIAFQSELSELNKELENASEGQIKFRFDNSAIRESLMATIPAIQKTAKALDDLDPKPKPKKKEEEKTIWDRMKDGFEDYKDTVEKGSLNIASITAKTMKSTEDAIVNMMMGVKTDFKALARSIIADLIRIQVRKKLVSAISSSSIGSFIGGFFANGGRPPVGRPSVVGERGAELFVPDTAGTIIPNDQLGGGQTINVTYAPQINALDPRTAAMVIAENAPTIVGVIRQAFNRNGQAVVI